MNIKLTDIRVTDPAKYPHMVGFSFFLIQLVSLLRALIRSSVDFITQMYRFYGVDASVLLWTRPPVFSQSDAPISPIYPLSTIQMTPPFLIF
jgi:hypothetical protein